MPNRKYAEGTRVAADRTQYDISRLLKAHGATAIGQGEREDVIAIYFELADRQIRFTLPVPSIQDDDIKYTRVNQSQWARRERSVGAKHIARDREFDRRLRARYACIKAKLISVEDQIETVEQAFMAEIVLANGQTMSEWAGPQINAMYESGRMPPLLPGLGGPQLPDTGGKDE